jgi:plasmid maintenance system antidote protein VapI
MNWKLKEKIVERYGTQFDFSQAVKVHESDVSRVVRGRKELPPEEKTKWAEVLGTEEKVIFGQEV